MVSIFISHTYLIFAMPNEELIFGGWVDDAILCTRFFSEESNPVELPAF